MVQAGGMVLHAVQCRGQRDPQEKQYVMLSNISMPLVYAGFEQPVMAIGK